MLNVCLLLLQDGISTNIKQCSLRTSDAFGGRQTLPHSLRPFSRLGSAILPKTSFEGDHKLGH